MIAVNSRKNIHPVQQAVEESLYLEDLLNDECKCESLHNGGTITCSIKVTHRVVFKGCGTRSKNVCFNTVQDVLYFHPICGWCAIKGLDGSDCQLIRPV